MCIEKLRKSRCVLGSVSILSMVCLTAGLVVVLAAGGCARITKGPVLLGVSGDEASLMWETNVVGPGEVLYGQGDSLDEKVTTQPLRVEYGIEKKGAAVSKKTAFIHKARLENLEPGRAYSYRVAGPAQMQSKMYKFDTVPADTNEVTFLVYGDSRTDPKTHRKVVEQMMKKKVDFVVNCGDLVSNGDSYRQWGPQFFSPVKGLVETVPMYISKGNHEGNNGNYEKLLILRGEKNSFSFDYGPLHYLCVDNVSKGLRSEEQLELITSDAKSSTAQWKFVSYHKPSLNFGGHWSMWEYPDALPKLAKSGVDFVITGHSHQYERFWPVAPPPGTKGSYVTHITCGGGGAPLSRVKQSLYHAYAGKIYHFCLFHIKDNKLTMDTFDIDGKIIDHLEIVKTDGRLNKQYLWTAVPVAAVRLHQDLHRTGPRPLAAHPEKNQPFTITYKLSVPALGGPAKIMFKLRCEEGAYKLPEAKTLLIPKEGGTFTAELTATPLVKVKAPKDKSGRTKAVVPALWLDCHYEVGRVQESISHSIRAKSKKAR
ncbi:MAG: purple acid phosphatase family protein [Planctomycetota bacterium]